MLQGDYKENIRSKVNKNNPWICGVLCLPYEVLLMHSR